MTEPPPMESGSPAPVDGPTGRRWFRIVLSSSVALILAGSACAPDAVTTQGDRVRDLYQLFLYAAGVVFVTVAGLIAWSIVRYRKRTGDDELPEQFHRSVGIEIVWFAVPQMLVIALFVVSTIALADVDDRDEPASLTMRVEGFQWGWRFEYEDAGVTVTGSPDDPAEIALPVGPPIDIELASTDVIHSFFVPRILVKRDMIPGRDNHLRVTLTEEGTFRGACAEFCGLLHDRMTFTIRAVDVQEFEDWLSEQEVIGGNG